MPFLGKTPAQGFVNSVTKDDFTPNGTTTAFTLSKTPATANEIEVYVGNVRQEPTSSYSVSGATLTMTEAPATGTNFYVMHIGGTTQSSTTLPGGSTVPGDFNVSGDLDVATGHVGIGAVSNTLSALYIHENDSSQGNTQLHIHNNKTDDAAVLRLESERTSLNDVGQLLFANNNSVVAKIEARSAADDGNLKFYTGATGSGNTIVERLEITTDGRALSQFTAKAWVSFNGSGTVAIKDHHNIASITDHGVGEYTASFTNSLANANYATVGMGSNWETTNTDSYMSVHGYEGGQTTAGQRVRTIRMRFDAGTVYKDPKTVNLVFFGD